MNLRELRKRLDGTDIAVDRDGRYGYFIYVDNFLYDSVDTVGEAAEMCRKILDDASLLDDTDNLIGHDL